MSRRLIPRGFTLVELLVVVAIIALLISILLPALDKARRTARAVACLTAQRQLYAGIQFYAQDYRGYFPPVLYLDHPTIGGVTGNAYWHLLIAEYLGQEDIETANDYSSRTVIWGCPEWNHSPGVDDDEPNRDTGYGMNDRPYINTRIENSPDPVQNKIAIYHGDPNDTFTGRIYRQAEIEQPANRGLIGDSREFKITRFINGALPEWNLTNAYADPLRHGETRMAVLLFDGHAELLDSPNSYRAFRAE